MLSNKGVYRTTDGGESWRLLNLGYDVLYAYNTIALNPAKPKEVFVGTMNGFYYSKDKGCHFTGIFPNQEILKHSRTH
jgi:photosystem II stability/assembly factor-like uncharacterized protein